VATDEKVRPFVDTSKKLNKSGSVGYLLLFKVNMTNTMALETQI
jgi:hypothetical protein